MSAKTQTFEKPDRTVYVKDTVPAKSLGMPKAFGPKALLGGDTYELLSSHGENIADELDWHETHCQYNDVVDSWIIDADAVDNLVNALEKHGYQVGQLTKDIVLSVHEYLPDDHDKTNWGELDISISVTYESGQSDKILEKSGTIEAYDPHETKLGFRRDDSVYMTIRGDELYSPQSPYPYVGDIERVEITFPSTDE
jgi:hypothetical protein